MWTNRRCPIPVQTSHQCPLTVHKDHDKWVWCNKPEWESWLQLNRTSLGWLRISSWSLWKNSQTFLLTASLEELKLLSLQSAGWRIEAYRLCHLGMHVQPDEQDFFVIKCIYAKKGKKNFIFSWSWLVLIFMASFQSHRYRCVPESTIPASFLC